MGELHQEREKLALDKQNKFKKVFDLIIFDG